MLWEDYLRSVVEHRQKKYRAPMNYARYEVCDEYGISEKTFYAIRSLLRDLCEDVEKYS